MDEEEIIMSYTEEVYERVVAQNPNEPEFHQAVKEVLDSLKVVIDKNEEKYRKLSILERLVEPERIISFRVPWVDDKGVVQVNKGYRVQFNSAIGRPVREFLKICSKPKNLRIPWFTDGWNLKPPLYGPIALLNCTR